MLTQVWSDPGGMSPHAIFQDESDQERSATIREAALQGLDSIAAKGDADCIRNVLNGLLHANPALRR